MKGNKLIMKNTNSMYTNLENTTKAWKNLMNHFDQEYYHSLNDYDAMNFYKNEYDNAFENYKNNRNKLVKINLINLKNGLITLDEFQTFMNEVY